MRRTCVRQTQRESPAAQAERIRLKHTPGLDTWRDLQPRRDCAFVSLADPLMQTVGVQYTEKRMAVNN